MDNRKRIPVEVSRQTIKRLPQYLNYLKSMEKQGMEYISAPTVAEALRLNEVQVRKDLASVSTRPGKPKKGFLVRTLVRDLEEYWVGSDLHEAVLIGAGRLGSAFLCDEENFRQHGMKILAGFDVNPAVIGASIGGKTVFSMERLENLCGRLGARIGILTVPSDSAQEACDALVAAGIRGIWNFAPVHLLVPDTVIVQNETLALPLSVLAGRVSEMLKKEEEWR